jgi:acetyl esterase/lipase
MSRSLRTIFVFVVILVTLTVTVSEANAAGSHKVEPLWTDGAPGAKGSEDGDKPTLTIYLPAKEKATGAAVVICPGGGYGHLAMDHEGHQIAQWLNSFGVAGFILQYRHSKSGAGYGHPAPLQDGLKSGTLIPAG